MDVGGDMAPVGIHDIAPKRNRKRTEGQERRMSKDYSKFKEKYLDSLDVDNVTGEFEDNDYPELIRCKDCIHRYSTCPMITIHPTGSITFRAQDDWFCFMGEGEKNERVHCQ